jgi:hypothetical protein
MERIEMSRAKKPTISSNPPNEKICEELFLAYTLQFARSGKVIMYAPSQVEEKQLGYDASLFVGQSYRELVLQFKKPHLEGTRNYRIDIASRSDTHQRDLLAQYPPYSAFYIAASFQNTLDLLQTQKNVLTVAGFLDRYIAIPAHILYEAHRVYFTKWITFRKVQYERMNRSQESIKNFDWLTGSKLLRLFLAPVNFASGAILKLDKSTNKVVLMPNPVQAKFRETRQLRIDQSLDELIEGEQVSTVHIRVPLESS